MSNINRNLREEFSRLIGQANSIWEEYFAKEKRVHLPMMGHPESLDQVFRETTLKAVEKLEVMDYIQAHVFLRKGYNNAAQWTDEVKSILQPAARAVRDIFAHEVLLPNGKLKKIVSYDQIKDNFVLLCLHQDFNVVIGTSEIRCNQDVIGGEYPARVPTLRKGYTLDFNNSGVIVGRRESHVPYIRLKRYDLESTYLLGTLPQ